MSERWRADRHTTDPCQYARQPFVNSHATYNLWCTQRAGNSCPADNVIELLCPADTLIDLPSIADDMTELPDCDEI